MLHHLGIFASDFEASRAFYATCLGALSINPEYEATDVAEFWRPDDDAPSLSLERAVDIVTRGVHLAFEAPDRAHVDDFFVASLAAHGTQRVAPRFWPEYRVTARSSAILMSTTLRRFIRKSGDPSSSN